MDTTIIIRAKLSDAVTYPLMVLCLINKLPHYPSKELLTQFRSEIQNTIAPTLRAVSNKLKNE